MRKKNVTKSQIEPIKQQKLEELRNSALSFTHNTCEKLKYLFEEDSH